jgi:hypothetical protein
MMCTRTGQAEVHCPGFFHALSLNSLLELSQRLHLPAINTGLQYQSQSYWQSYMVATVILSSMAQQAHYFHHNSDRNMLNCKVSTASTRIESQSRTGLAWAIHNRRLVFEVRKQPANVCLIRNPVPLALTLQPTTVVNLTMSV